MFLSLKTAFEQSGWLTFLKYCVLVYVYFMIALAGIIGAIIVGLLTL